jgi:hypothetical protein
MNNQPEFDKKGFGNYLLESLENPAPSPEVRYPNAYRDLYHKIMRVIIAYPVPTTEEQAKLITGEILDCFDE